MARHFLTILSLAALGWSLSCEVATGDALVEGFQTPPASARPRVWWHWMDGNVTKPGIRQDLEWMKRVGIGGVQQFDGAFTGWGAPFDTPKIVAQPVVYGSPEWREALRYSVTLAQALDLEFGIASSAGWTLTGGPSVKPQQAMKKLVWSETQLAGGVPFKGYLTEPPHAAGHFQDIPLPERIHPAGWRETPSLFGDIAVMAVREPLSEQALVKRRRMITASDAALNTASLTDGDLSKAQLLPFGGAPSAWIQYAFDQPVSVQALSFVVDRGARYPLTAAGPEGWLEAIEASGQAQRILTLPQTGAGESSALQQTLSFAPVTAQTFRVVFQRPLPSGDGAPIAGYRIAELVLHSGARVNRFEDKAGFSTRQIDARDDTPSLERGEVIPRQAVIDLTDRVRRDGFLQWTPPPGRWTVLRFGYSLTGRLNEPAPAAGTGLEGDKLNPHHVRTYLETYLSRLEEALGPGLIGRSGLRAVLTDSYEAGPQNWTEDLLKEFQARRGYDLRPWLPVLAGRVIDSALSSDRLLWDFRKTLGELLAESHYGEISAVLHERGLTHYGESQEYRRHLIGDGMLMKQSVDIPMGAMWAQLPESLQANYEADLRESAAVANIYGRPVVAAESFTGGEPYGVSPQELKPTADRMLALGVNQFAIHTSAHQPDDRVGPGIGLGPIGLWFTRKETWAEQATAWIDYLARSSYLLQQGKVVADIAYLYGEDANVTSLFHTQLPQMPAGYHYDFVNAEALIQEFAVQDGRLRSRAGMSYRILVLDPSTRRMSLALLKGIRDLAQAGALIVGAKPLATPSLADDESEFHALAAQLWDERRLVSDRSLAEVLEASQIRPDVSFNTPASVPLRFIHRELEEGDLYFVSNGTAGAQTVEASFRLHGKRPELWHADTGEISPASYRMENGRTIVRLSLLPHEAVFVVFRAPAVVRSARVPEPKVERLTTLTGSWEVTFPPGLGAPERARFEGLSSWTERADAGVKYFSGTASYSKAISVRRGWLQSGSRLRLDLGQVRNVAEVLVNGRSMGIAWKAPFSLDITDGVHTGENRLEIRVSNLWPNRLIGDKQPGAKRIAFATFDPFEANSPLLPSGLLGPVTLSRIGH